MQAAERTHIYDIYKRLMKAGKVLFGVDISKDSLFYNYNNKIDIIWCNNRFIRLPFEKSFTIINILVKS